MKRRFLIILTMLLVLGLSVLGVVLYYCTDPELIETHYTVEADVDAPLSIVHLTDLHNTEFGEDNRHLIDLVSQQNPDLIVMTGDMLNQDDESLEIVCGLISNLSEIAPVYFSYGNHETSWETTWGRDLAQPLTEVGAIILNNEYIDTEVNGQKFRIGGYMGYYRQPHMMTSGNEQKALELAFADDFEDTERFKILLNHIPTAWVDWGYIDKFPVDVVFSGHYHGGVIQIPLLDRGIYAPYVGFFPRYTKGVFAGTQATCVLSAGLSSEYLIPRINNPPEIVVIYLVPYSE